MPVYIGNHLHCVPGEHLHPNNAFSDLCDNNKPSYRMGVRILGPCKGCKVPTLVPEEPKFKFENFKLEAPKLPGLIRNTHNHQLIPINI